MAKLSLTDVTTGYLIAPQININFSFIEEALENTLSRDGTTPNTMEAALDMNSNRIINVGEPVGAADAVRLIDLQTTNGLTDALPPQTGNEGNVLTTDGNVVFWTSAPTLVQIDSGNNNLTLSTINGQTQLELLQSTATSHLQIAGSSANEPFIRSTGNAANVNNGYATKGSGSHRFETDAFNNNPVQFEVTHTTNATNHLTVTGSNGSDPTLSTSGGKINLGAVVTGSILFRRKTADESVTSSTTLQDDDHLTFPLAANEERIGDVEIVCGGSLTTTGVKIAMTVPAGATLQFFGVLTTTAGSFSLAGNTTTSGSAAIATTPGTGSSGVLKMSFWVLNGANSGNATIQWAQNASSGTALTFLKGSFLRTEKVA